MAYTVTNLITNAYYISGIVSRDFQIVSGSQINDGLQLTNEVLTDKYADKGMVPYFTQYNFNAVIGQEAYFIPNLIEIETLVFFISNNTVRYSMRKNGRIAYFGNARANTVQSLPFNWHFERSLGGGSIYLYFLPQEAFPMQLWGQFGLTEVALNQDLTLTYDQFYISYLKYALCKKLCLNFNYDMPPGAKEELLKYELMISKRVGPMDLHAQHVSTLGKSHTLNYATANLGRGWTT
jgi:hypothetical protein